MDWQQPVSLAIVAVAAGLLLWGRWRARGALLLHGHACGCSGTNPPPPGALLRYRARKGERPRLIIRGP